MKQNNGPSIRKAERSQIIHSLVAQFYLDKVLKQDLGLFFRHSFYRENCAIMDSSILVRHQNVVRMLICIVAVFAIFWFPGQLAWLILTFSEGSEKWNTLLEISQLFIFANSALNPLIFFAYNKEYCAQASGTSLWKDVKKLKCRWRYGRTSVSEQAPELRE